MLELRVVAHKQMVELCRHCAILSVVTVGVTVSTAAGLARPSLVARQLRHDFLLGRDLFLLRGIAGAQLLLQAIDVRARHRRRAHQVNQEAQRLDFRRKRKLIPLLLADPFDDVDPPARRELYHIKLINKFVGIPVSGHYSITAHSASKGTQSWAPVVSNA